MSSDESPNAARPSERRDAVREKAQQVQASSRARARSAPPDRRGFVAVVAVAAVVVTWVVASAARDRC